MLRKYVTFGVFTIMLFLGATIGAHAQSQAIYNGTVRINGDIPEDLPKVLLAKQSGQVLREAHYAPATGSYGVSAYSWDGLEEKEAIQFLVVLQNDTITAHTWGNPAIYVGTSLNPPIPPVPITINLTNNLVPSFTSTPAGVAHEDTVYTYQPSANDPDDDALSFAYIAGPSWLHYDTTTATLSGTPGPSDIGTAEVSIRVDDHHFRGTATQMFQLTVVHTNHPPRFTTKPPVVAVEDQAYRYEFDAADADGDSFAFSFPDLPSWLHQDSVTVLKGTPSGENVGDNIVSIRATDENGGSTTQTFTLHVTHINHAPGAFHRIGPADSTIVHLPANLVLNWERSLDIDTKDTVRYILHITVASANIDTSIVVPDTAITAPLEGLHLPPNVLLEIQWSVAATDGIAQTLCANGTGFFIVQTPNGVSDSKRIPAAYNLMQNYPNTFNPTTEIAYDLPQSSEVRVSIYNILGVEVRVLVAGTQAAGSYHIQWDGKNETGAHVSSGMYLYRIVANGANGKSFTVTRKMTMMK